jgi:hypothetical protein
VKERSRLDAPFPAFGGTSPKGGREALAKRLSSPLGEGDPEGVEGARGHD